LDQENSLEELAPPVQTLSNFPTEKLNGEMVLVRFDANLVLNTSNSHDKSSLERAISTNKYLHDSNSYVIIATNWTASEDPTTRSQQSLSG
jgi:3-phosphoglycerate kinase